MASIKGLSVGKPAVEKTAKQAAVNATKESSVIAQIRELVWIGQPIEAIDLASQAVNLFQALED